jgi:hypothetical protein
MTIERMKAVAKQYDEQAKICHDVAVECDNNSRWLGASSIWTQAAIVLREAIIDELEAGK